jgi:hypothetical protein
MLSNSNPFVVCEMKHKDWWTDILHWIQGTKCWNKLFPNFLTQFSVVLNAYCRSSAGSIASTIIKALWMCRISVKLQVHTTTISLSISFYVYDSLLPQNRLHHQNIIIFLLYVYQCVCLVCLFTEWFIGENFNKKFNRKRPGKVVEHEI